MALLLAFLAFDTFRTLKRGRAHTWMDGTATREGQPAKFWRYMYEAYIGMAFFGGAILWAWFWPDSLR